MKTNYKYNSLELLQKPKEKIFLMEKGHKINEIHMEKGHKIDEIHDHSMDLLIRNDYVRKTLLILVFQICLTIGLVSKFLQDHKILSFIQENYFLLMFLTVLAFFICCILFFKKKFASQFPLNYLLILLFTFCESYITSYYLAKIEDKHLIYVSLGITFGITIVISIIV